jgi:enterochelin esterase-like enzyme
LILLSTVSSVGMAAQNSQQQLLADTALEQSIGLREEHVYFMQMTNGEAMAVDVLQQSIDVVVNVSDPAGIPVLHKDRNGVDEVESIMLTAFSTGTYKITITPFDVKAPAGRYKLSVKPKLTLAENQLRLAKQQYSNPQIFQLYKDALHDKTALDKFVALHKGKPLMEAVVGNNTDMRVTFYTLGQSNTDYVMFSGGPDFNGLIMTQLGKTKLYFMSLLVAKKAQYLYAFNYYNRKVAGPNGEIELIDRQRSDLIPLAMPNAPANPYLAKTDGIAKGQLIDKTLKSQALARDIDIKVYLPPGYSVNKAHKLLIMLDGEEYSKPAQHGGPSDVWVPTPTILDNLIAANKIKSSVAVFVSNMGKRDTLLVDDKLGQFVSEELLDWLRANYALSVEAKDVVLAGSSRGAYAATNIALTYPNKIGNVLSMSGAYWINNTLLQIEKNGHFFPNQYVYGREAGLLINKVKKQGAVTTRFYISVGLYDDGLAVVGTNRQLRDVLQLKGANVQYSEFFGGHGYFSWRNTIHLGLIHFLATSALKKHSVGAKSIN